MLQPFSPCKHDVCFTQGQQRTVTNAVDWYYRRAFYLLHVMHPSVDHHLLMAAVHACRVPLGVTGAPAWRAMQQLMPCLLCASCSALVKPAHSSSRGRSTQSGIVLFCEGWVHVAAGAVLFWKLLALLLRLGCICSRVQVLAGRRCSCSACAVHMQQPMPR